ncbi:MAG: hypothetical protein ACE37H_15845 [Phycisphaeraceae bacterium]
MQRPTRIVVFGVLCLLVGFFSGLSNGGELLMSAMGPSFMKSTQSEAMMNAMPEAVRESNQASEAALGKPVYRVGLGIEAGLGLVMAGALIVAGVGLLLDKLWALRLARVWGFYALVASAFSVVLVTRYVTPETPSATPGTEMMGACCMLPMLWLFPVLLLTMLNGQSVRRYLQWRAQHAGPGQPVATRVVAHDTDAPERPAARPTSATLDSESTAPGPPSDPPPPSDHDTWRDDPWNDPGAGRR